MAQCESCFKVRIDGCSSKLIFELQLLADTDYILVVKDKFNHEYRVEVTTDDAGAFEIQTNNDVFPEGLFNPYAGNFNFSILTTAGLTQEFIINETTYECIDADVYQGNSEETIIPDPNNETSEAPEPPGEPGGLTCDDLEDCESFQELANEVIVVRTDFTQADATLQDQINFQQGLIDGYSQIIADHNSDLNNPHQTTLAQVVDADNFINQSIDANGFTVHNLPAPSAAGDAVPKSYVDGLIDKSLKVPEAYNPTGTSLYPVTYAGVAIQAGDSFRITAAGTMNGVAVDAEDLLIANVDTPGQTIGNWHISESNRSQATESVKGVAKIATQAVVENEEGTNNEDIVTPQKFWFGILRFLALAWTWAAKQTFTLAPRFNSAIASQYLKVDASKDLTSVAAIPATDVTEDTTHRFATDAEKTTWNAKQAPLGYTPVNAANISMTVKSADQATSSTSFSDATSLSFAIGANEVYSFEMILNVVTSSTNGSVWQFTLPSGAECVIHVVANNTTTSNLTTAVLLSSASPTAAMLNAVFAAGLMRISGVIVNSSTGGTVQLQFRTSNVANTVTIKKNSFVRATKQ